MEQLCDDCGTAGTGGTPRECDGSIAHNDCPAPCGAHVCPGCGPSTNPPLSPNYRHVLTSSPPALLSSMMKGGEPIKITQEYKALKEVYAKLNPGNPNESVIKIIRDHVPKTLNDALKSGDYGNVTVPEGFARELIETLAAEKGRTVTLAKSADATASKERTSPSPSPEPKEPKEPTEPEPEPENEEPENDKPENDKPENDKPENEEREVAPPLPAAVPAPEPTPADDDMTLSQALDMYQGGASDAEGSNPDSDTEGTQIAIGGEDGGSDTEVENADNSDTEVEEIDTSAAAGAVVPAANFGNGTLFSEADCKQLATCSEYVQGATGAGGMAGASAMAGVLFKNKGEAGKFVAKAEEAAREDPDDEVAQFVLNSVEKLNAAPYEEYVRMAQRVFEFQITTAKHHGPIVVGDDNGGFRFLKPGEPLDVSTLYGPAPAYTINNAGAFRCNRSGKPIKSRRKVTGIQVFHALWNQRLVVLAIPYFYDPKKKAMLLWLPSIVEKYMTGEVPMPEASFFEDMDDMARRMWFQTRLNELKTVTDAVVRLTLNWAAGDVVKEPDGDLYEHYAQVRHLMTGCRIPTVTMEVPHGQSALSFAPFYLKQTLLNRGYPVQDFSVHDALKCIAAGTSLLAGATAAMRFGEQPDFRYTTFVEQPAFDIDDTYELDDNYAEEVPDGDKIERAVLSMKSRLETSCPIYYDTGTEVTAADKWYASYMNDMATLMKQLGLDYRMMAQCLQQVNTRLLKATATMSTALAAYIDVDTSVGSGMQALEPMTGPVQPMTDAVIVQRATEASKKRGDEATRAANEAAKAAQELLAEKEREYNKKLAEVELEKLGAEKKHCEDMAAVAKKGAEHASDERDAAILKLLMDTVAHASGAILNPSKKKDGTINGGTANPLVGPITVRVAKFVSEMVALADTEATHGDKVKEGVSAFNDCMQDIASKPQALGAYSDAFAGTDRSAADLIHMATTNPPAFLKFCKAEAKRTKEDSAKFTDKLVKSLKLAGKGRPYEDYAERWKKFDKTFDWRALTSDVTTDDLGYPASGGAKESPRGKRAAEDEAGPAQESGKPTGKRNKSDDKKRKADAAGGKAKKAKK